MAKKKQKPTMKKRFKRAVKQNAYFTNPTDEFIVNELVERVQNARNYLYSRLSGINSYLEIQKPKKIRDKWVKDQKLVEQFKLPARYWKLVLEDVCANIKSLWSNTCNKIKEVAKENGTLTADETH